MLDESGTAEISEWCERSPIRIPRSAEDVHTLTEFWKWRGPIGRDTSAGGKWVPRYNFAESRDACAEFERLLEAKTERLPDGRGYFEAYLVAIAEAAGTQLLGDVWNATPEQRCAAMRRVIRETKGRA